MINVTRLSNEVIDVGECILCDPYNDNYYKDIVTFVDKIFKKEIESQREFLFIISLKKTIIKSARIINVGGLSKNFISYRELVQSALNDEADEVIICHNHPVILQEKPIDAMYASSTDLIVFSNIFQIFLLLGIRVRCGVFGGSANYATFYFPQNDENCAPVIKSGYTNKKIQVGNKELTQAMPFVAYDKVEFIFNYVTVAPPKVSSQTKGKDKKQASKSKSKV
jgi:hypothetical protein